MIDTKPQPMPTLIIAMGVSGCGKTDIAEAIAAQLSIEFIEADEHHSMEAIALMKGGRPLTDAMRGPWINSICSAVEALTQQNRSVIIACSALKKSHRDKFRALGLPCLFLYLDGSEALINTRLHKRAGHFFPSTLLKSQFDALEDPRAETDVTSIDISPPLEEVVNIAMVAAQNFIRGAST